MTANQFRATLARLGLSQRGASRLFNVNERTVRRWASGDIAVPEGIVTHLQTMLTMSEKPKRVSHASS